MKWLIVLYLINLVILLLASFRGGLQYKFTEPSLRPSLILVLTLFVLKTVQLLSLDFGLAGKLAYELEQPIQLLLICWQARRWKLLKMKPIFYWVFIAGALTVFAAEQLNTTTPKNSISLFDLSSSFFITLLGIESLSKAMIQSKNWPFKNPVILFSIGWILYFSFTGLLEMFMLIGKDYSAAFYMKIAYVDIIIGLITHSIYLYAVVCIPSKTSFSTSSLQQP